ncbi:MAG: hypothetical protein MZV49_05590 [Rhodopseudomonas palustris]|nr:hypothetical protein [Rhodopseudomonas palustris]
MRSASAQRQSSVPELAIRSERNAPGGARNEVETLLGIRFDGDREQGVTTLCRIEGGLQCCVGECCRAPRR